MIMAAPAHNAPQLFKDAVFATKTRPNADLHGVRLFKDSGLRCRHRQSQTGEDTTALYSHLEEEGALFVTARGKNWKRKPLQRSRPWHRQTL